MFTVKFSTANAAFDGENSRRNELARILRKIAGEVENGFTSQNILDVNGNTVGKWNDSAA